MKERNFLGAVGTILITLALFVFSAGVVFSQTAADIQDCQAYLYHHSYPDTLDRDGLAQNVVSIPVEFGLSGNGCAIGGIQFDVIVDPPGSLVPVAIDTVGSIVSGWGFVSGTPNVREPGRLRFFAMWRFLDPPTVPPYTGGSGDTVCQVIFDFGCNYQTCTWVSLLIDSVWVYDTTGYVQYPCPLGYGSVYIGPDVTGMNEGDSTLINSGDSNCDRRLINSDVTRLVAWFRGSEVPCPCSRCAGDANGDGMILGGDITYIVRYFSGTGNPPVTCEFHPCQ